jgi:ESCRT-II complex subunit VPS36
MFLQPVDLTPALRPSLLPGESLLFVQDGVGLYEEYLVTLESQVATD